MASRRANRKNPSLIPASDYIDIGDTVVQIGDAGDGPGRVREVVTVRARPDSSGVFRDVEGRPFDRQFAGKAAALVDFKLFNDWFPLERLMPASLGSAIKRKPDRVQYRIATPTGYFARPKHRTAGANKLDATAGQATLFDTKVEAESVIRSYMLKRCQIQAVPVNVRGVTSGSTVRANPLWSKSSAPVDTSIVARPVSQFQSISSPEAYGMGNMVDSHARSNEPHFNERIFHPHNASARAALLADPKWVMVKVDGVKKNPSSGAKQRARGTRGYDPAPDPTRLHVPKSHDALMSLARENRETMRAELISRDLYAGRLRERMADRVEKTKAHSERLIGRAGRLRPHLPNPSSGAKQKARDVRDWKSDHHESIRSQLHGGALADAEDIRRLFLSEPTPAGRAEMTRAHKAWMYRASRSAPMLPNPSSGAKQKARGVRDYLPPAHSYARASGSRHEAGMAAAADAREWAKWQRRSGTMYRAVALDHTDRFHGPALKYASQHRPYLPNPKGDLSQREVTVPGKKARALRKKFWKKAKGNKGMYVALCIEAGC